MKMKFANQHHQHYSLPLLRNSSRLSQVVILSLSIFVIILAISAGSSDGAPALNQQLGKYKSAINSSYRDRGCYYMLQHYKNGDQIKTDEPCLNCTCENSMLMCYLRVCPYVKPVGDRCLIERVQGECCPRITCPDVLPQLEQDIEPETLPPPTTTTSTTTTTTTPSSIDRIRANESVIAISSSGGCMLRDVYYHEGALMPSDEGKPCEVCYCIRNHASCVMQDCALDVSGCAPIYQPGGCCPTRYNCSVVNAFTTPRPQTSPVNLGNRPGRFWETVVASSKIESSLKSSVQSTTTTTLKPIVLPDFGRLSPSTLPPPGCRSPNSTRVFADGEKVPSKNKCEHCYCMRHEIVCAIQECRPPCDGCTPIMDPTDECCPKRYECAAPTLRVSTDNIIDAAEASTLGPEPKQSVNITVETSTTVPSGDQSSSAATSNDATINSSSTTVQPDETSSNLVTASELSNLPEVSHMTTRQTKPPLRPISPKISNDDEAVANDMLPELDSTRTNSKDSNNVDGFNVGGEREQDNEPNKSIGKVVATEGSQPVTGGQGQESNEVSIMAPSSKPVPEESSSSSTTTVTPLLSTIASDNLVSAGGDKKVRPSIVPSTVPGEGHCRYNGKIYQNGQEVKSKDTCMEICMCINSVVYCDEIDCPKGPENQDNCTRVMVEGECCPKWVCRDGRPVDIATNTNTTPVPSFDTTAKFIEETTKTSTETISSTSWTTTPSLETITLPAEQTTVKSQESSPSSPKDLLSSLGEQSTTTTINPSSSLPSSESNAIDSSSPSTPVTNMRDNSEQLTEAPTTQRPLVTTVSELISNNRISSTTVKGGILPAKELESTTVLDQNSPQPSTAEPSTEPSVTITTTTSNLDLQTTSSDSRIMEESTSTNFSETMNTTFADSTSTSTSGVDTSTEKVSLTSTTDMNDQSSVYSSTQSSTKPQTVPTTQVPLEKFEIVTSNWTTMSLPESSPSTTTEVTPKPVDSVIIDNNQKADSSTTPASMRGIESVTYNSPINEDTSMITGKDDKGLLSTPATISLPTTMAPIISSEVSSSSTEVNSVTSTSTHPTDESVLPSSPDANQIVTFTSTSGTKVVPSSPPFSHLESTSSIQHGPSSAGSGSTEFLPTTTTTTVSTTTSSGSDGAASQTTTSTVAPSSTSEMASNPEPVDTVVTNDDSSKLLNSTTTTAPAESESAVTTSESVALPDSSGSPNEVITSGDATPTKPIVPVPVDKLATTTSSSSVEYSKDTSSSSSIVTSEASTTSSSQSTSSSAVSDAPAATTLLSEAAVTEGSASTTVAPTTVAGQDVSRIVIDSATSTTVPPTVVPVVSEQTTPSASAVLESITTRAPKSETDDEGRATDSSTQPATQTTQKQLEATTGSTATINDNRQIVDGSTTLVPMREVEIVTSNPTTTSAPGSPSSMPFETTTNGTGTAVSDTTPSGAEIVTFNTVATSSPESSPSSSVTGIDIAVSETTPVLIRGTEIVTSDPSIAVTSETSQSMAAKTSTKAIDTAGNYPVPTKGVETVTFDPSATASPGSSLSSHADLTTKTVEIDTSDKQSADTPTTPLPVRGIERLIQNPPFSDGSGPITGPPIGVSRKLAPTSDSTTDTLIVNNEASQPRLDTTTTPLPNRGIERLIQNPPFSDGSGPFVGPPVKISGTPTSDSTADTLTVNNEASQPRLSSLEPSTSTPSDGSVADFTTTLASILQSVTSTKPSLIDEGVLPSSPDANQIVTFTSTSGTKVVPSSPTSDQHHVANGNIITIEDSQKTTESRINATTITPIEPSSTTFSEIVTSDPSIAATSETPPSTSAQEVFTVGSGSTLMPTKSVTFNPTTDSLQESSSSTTEGVTTNISEAVTSESTPIPTREATSPTTSSSPEPTTTAETTPKPIENITSGNEQGSEILTTPTSVRGIELVTYNPPINGDTSLITGVDNKELSSTLAPGSLPTTMTPIVVNDVSQSSPSSTSSSSTDQFVPSSSSAANQIFTETPGSEMKVVSSSSPSSHLDGSSTAQHESSSSGSSQTLSTLVEVTTKMMETVASDKTRTDDNPTTPVTTREIEVVTYQPPITMDTFSMIGSGSSDTSSKTSPTTQPVTTTTPIETSSSTPSSTEVSQTTTSDSSVTISSVTPQEIEQSTSSGESAGSSVMNQVELGDSVREKIVSSGSPSSQQESSSQFASAMQPESSSSSRQTIEPVINTATITPISVSVEVDQQRGTSTPSPSSSSDIASNTVPVDTVIINETSSELLNTTITTTITPVEPNSSSSTESFMMETSEAAFGREKSEDTSNTPSDVKNTGEPMSSSSMTNNTSLTNEVSSSLGKVNVVEATSEGRLIASSNLNSLSDVSATNLAPDVNEASLTTTTSTTTIDQNTTKAIPDASPSSFSGTPEPTTWVPKLETKNDERKTLEFSTLLPVETTQRPQEIIVTSSSSAGALPSAEIDTTTDNSKQSADITTTPLPIRGVEIMTFNPTTSSSPESSQSILMEITTKGMNTAASESTSSPTRRVEIVTINPTTDSSSKSSSSSPLDVTTKTMDAESSDNTSAPTRGVETVTSNPTATASPESSPSSADLRTETVETVTSDNKQSADTPTTPLPNRGIERLIQNPPFSDGSGPFVGPPVKISGTPTSDSTADTLTVNNEASQPRLSSLEPSTSTPSDGSVADFTTTLASILQSVTSTKPSLIDEGVLPSSPDANQIVTFTSTSGTKVVPSSPTSDQHHVANGNIITIEDSQKTTESRINATTITPIEPSSTTFSEIVTSDPSIAATSETPPSTSAQEVFTVGSGSTLMPTKSVTFNPTTDSLQESSSSTTEGVTTNISEAVTSESTPIPTREATSPTTSSSPEPTTTAETTPKPIENITSGNEQGSEILTTPTSVRGIELVTYNPPINGDTSLITGVDNKELSSTLAPGSLPTTMTPIVVNDVSQSSPSSTSSSSTDQFVPSSSSAANQIFTETPGSEMKVVSSSSPSSHLDGSSTAQHESSSSGSSQTLSTLVEVTTKMMETVASDKTRTDDNPTTPVTTREIEVVTYQPPITMDTFSMIGSGSSDTSSKTSPTTQPVTTTTPIETSSSTPSSTEVSQTTTSDSSVTISSVTPQEIEQSTSSGESAGSSVMNQVELGDSVREKIVSSGSPSSQQESSSQFASAMQPESSSSSRQTIEPVINTTTITPISVSVEVDQQRGTSTPSPSSSSDIASNAMPLDTIVSTDNPFKSLLNATAGTSTESSSLPSAESTTATSSEASNDRDESGDSLTTPSEVKTTGDPTSTTPVDQSPSTMSSNSSTLIPSMSNGLTMTHEANSGSSSSSSTTMNTVDGVSSSSGSSSTLNSLQDASATTPAPISAEVSNSFTTLAPEQFANVTSSPADVFVARVSTISSVPFEAVNITTTISSIRGMAATITIPWQDIRGAASNSSSSLEQDSSLKSNSSSSLTSTEPSVSSLSTSAGTSSSDSDYEEVTEESGCEYEGKAYNSAQQIPRSHPCDFCFCFRGDIICLQQTCPPPVPHCFETVMDGFCCPRYECPVHTVRQAINSTGLALSPFDTTRTNSQLTSSQEGHNKLSPQQQQQLSNAKNSRVKGCFVDNKLYPVDSVIESASGPCLDCRCDRSGMMKCIPKECTPEDPLLQQINREVLQSTLSRSQARRR